MLDTVSDWPEDTFGNGPRKFEYAWAGFATESKPLKGPLKKSMRDLRRLGLGTVDKPESWLYFSAHSQHKETIKQIETKVAHGHVIGNILEDQVLFHTIELAVEESVQDAEKIDYLRTLARIKLLSYANATTSNDQPKGETPTESHKLPKSATDEDLGKSIRNNDGILITLNIGRKWHVGFFNKDKWHFQTLGSVSDVINSSLEAKDRLYFTCYGSECEKLRIGLGEGLRRLSIIASPDQIPDFFQMRKLAKSTLTIVSERDSANETYLQNQFTNIDANFVIGPSWESVRKSAGSAHILVMNAPLKVGHEKPWNASFGLSDSNIWPLRDAQLGAPWYNTALVFPNLSALEGNLDPMTVYTYLSVWLQLQRVPMALIGTIKETVNEKAKETVKETVKLTETPKPQTDSVTNSAKGAPPVATMAMPSKQVEGLTQDLQKILSGNTAEAIKGYVRIGDSGLLESEALDFAKQHLEIAKNKAEDARDDKLFLEAKRFFMEALHYAEILKLPSEALAINDSLVKTLFQAREYQSALHFQSKRIRMLKSTGAKEEDIAAAEMEAGILATRASIGSVARQHLKAAEIFYQKDQDEEKLPQIYHYIGLSYEGEGEFQKTIESYEQSRTLSDKVGRKIDAAQKLLDIGNIYKERLSNLPLALDFYGKAFEAFEKLGQQDRLISVQIDRANTLMAMGETKWAINVIERRVLNAIEATTNPGLWIRSAQIVANAYYRAGMFQESQAYISKIRATTPALKDETSRANANIDCDNLWAMNSEKLGNHGEASVVFDQSLNLARKFKLRGKESMILNNIGFWAREAGDVAQSLTYFEQALAIDKDLKSEADQAYDLRNMAMSWTILGNLVQASSAAQQALDTSSRLKLAHNEAYSLFALAEIQMKKAAPVEALKLFQRAKEVAVKAYLQDFVWRADAAIANVEMSMQNLDKAATAYANSVTIIESMRAGLSSQSSKTGFASDRGVQDVYAGIVRVLMKLGRIEEAWVYSERGRARSFIDAMGSKAQTFGDPALDQAMEDERRLRSDEEVLERRLATTPDKTPEAVVVRAALAKANADRKRKITEVTTKWPRVTPFIGVQKMDLSVVKSRLNRDTAILEFMCLEDETAFWVIQNGVIHGGLIAIKRKELNAKISQYRELMQNFAAVKATARDLSEVLLKEPFKYLKTAKELIIVPHGELHYLPFVSLPVQDQFLIDQFPVSYLESAEMLRFASVSGKKISNRSKLVAFGNPDRGPELDLPFSEREVHALDRSFKNSKSVFGKNASEQNFVTMIKDADIVHFAGHGEFIESDAAASRLLFANNDDLTVKEMFKLQMPVSLVTLSACETGLGKLSSGDEMVGFNRALFFSGAASIVSSLWRVSDVASSVTIKRFYSGLAKDTPKAEALRAAQIVVRKYYNHPAYWSAFKLSGER